MSFPIPRFAGAALALLSACGSSTQSRYYTLSTLAAPDAATQAPQSGKPPVLRVAPVGVPELLDRPQIVRRSGENTLEVAEFDRWSEPLDSLLRRALVEDLAALLPSVQVLGIAAPGLRADRSVLVEVDRLESTPGGAVSFQARWFLFGDDAAEPLIVRRAALVERAVTPSYADTASAVSRVVAALSRQIASGVEDSARPVTERKDLPSTRR